MLATEPVRDEQADFLIRGAYTEGRVWLLSDAGQLFSLSQHDKSPRREATTEPVIDMCVLDGQLTILTAPTNTQNDWTLSQRQAGKWIDQARVAVEKTDLVGMMCADHSAMLLTHKHLVIIKGKVVQSLKLQDDIGYGIATTLVTEDSVYLGLNKGEWGGGLHVIDRVTGQVTHINNNQSGRLCGGPLNAECDPVNGLAIVPW